MKTLHYAELFQLSFLLHPLSFLLHNDIRFHCRREKVSYRDFYGDRGKQYIIFLI